MNESICKRFAICLMQRGVINPHPSLKIKRPLRKHNDPRQNDPPEIEDISAPLAIVGDHPVIPAGVTQYFPVLHEVKRVLAHDLVLVAKHEQTGPSRMKSIIVSASADSAYPQEEIIVLQIEPRMLGANRAQRVSIASHRFRAYGILLQMGQHGSVLNAVAVIPQHCADFSLRAAVIALAVSPECPHQGICVKKHRPRIMARARNANHYDAQPIFLFDGHIAVSKKIGTHLCGIVDRIPE